MRAAPVQVTARAIARPEIDLLDSASVTKLFKAEQPSIIIHCAAMAKPNDCDANPELARRTNIEVTKHLADLANDIPFIFFSTDLVFDGGQGNYTEEDSPNPLSLYAETKARAEELVRQHPQHTLIRLSLTGGHSREGNRGFNEEMKNAWRAGRTLNLFIDEYRCPASADIIARAVWELIAQNARGIFHLCGAERLSRFQIGELLADKHPELHPKINPGSRKDYKGPPRPPDTSMDCAKAQRLLSFQLPRFSDRLAQDTTGY